MVIPAVISCIITSKGAGPDMYYSAAYASPIGEITLACDGAGGLAGLWLQGQKYFLALPETPVPGQDVPVLVRARAWLDRYFAGERPAPSELPLAPAGGAFRREV